MATGTKKSGGASGTTSNTVNIVTTRQVAEQMYLAIAKALGPADGKKKKGGGGKSKGKGKGKGKGGGGGKGKSSAAGGSSSRGRG